jgi:ABC-type cobalamin/Fe3+-siderophores transport system ATPase subunit
VDRLDVPSGQVVTLLGANGAGKTTLLRCLLGLQGFRAGRLEVLGQRPGRRATHLRRRIGYVPQLLPVAGRLPLTVREVVSIGRMGRAGLLRRLGRKDWQVIDRWIDRLGLGELAQRRYARISGGEQRRTLLARAMVQEPRLLLLDEPTANLDLSARERIVARIDRLGRMQDLTVLLVCHELEVIPPACRRVVVMRQGAIIQDGPAGQVLTDATVGTLYDAALRVTQQAGRWATVPGGAHA